MQPQAPAILSMVVTGCDGQDWFLANRLADNGGVLDLFSDKSASELWDDTDF